MKEKASTTEDAKRYIVQRQIPQLFESLMTGLMCNRPDDHFKYMIDCLEKAREDGGYNVSWNAFVDLQKDALPPISKQNSAGEEIRGAKALLEQWDTEFSTDQSNSEVPTEMKKASPLPPIGQTTPAKDEQRTDSADLSKVPIVIIMGGLESDRHDQCEQVLALYRKHNWKHISDKKLIEQCEDDSLKELVAKGELIPDEAAIELLKSALNNCQSPGGILIDGFPRTTTQAEALAKLVPDISLVLLIDKREEKCRQHLLEHGDEADMIDNKLKAYMKQTLPVVHQYDTEKKLVLLEGDKDSADITKDIERIFDVAFYDSDSQPPISTEALQQLIQVSKSRSPSPTDELPKVVTSDLQQPVIDLAVADTGKQNEITTAKIVFFLGGPGCGKASQSERLVSRFPGLVHLSIGNLLRSKASTDDNEELKAVLKSGELASEDIVLELLMDAIKQQDGEIQIIVIDGFPRTQKQLELFNEKIGGLSLAILLENEEEELRSELSSRGRDDDTAEAIEKRLCVFKECTLPVIRYLDSQDKLKIVENVPGHEEVHYKLTTILSSIVDDTPLTKAQQNSTDLTEVPVVEEIIAADIAQTTGETGNPSYTKELEENAQMAELQGKKVIFVVGGPGCGKGTQCAKIVDKYGFCHLSSGDLLRDEVKSGSERGNELNAIMESGALVSLDIVLTLIKEAMLKNTEANGFLIDGYPRELEQGTRFESEIVPPACVLYFEVADDVMVERLLERAKTSGRVDDNEETIKKRLDTFHTHSDAVLNHYEQKGLLCKIDARGTVDAIFEEVVKNIEEAK